MLVGGFVRDALLGRVSNDVDVATSLRPERVRACLAGEGLAARGRSEFGAMEVRVDDCDVTVTTYRRDGAYLDHRRPSTVEFVDTPGDDAVRRDFTVNALYADPFGGDLIDPVGGLADLESGTLRVIGDAERRLREDPLRILRAVRFAARLGFAFSPGTDAAIRSSVGELDRLSGERVFAELTDAFTGVGRGTALRLLVETGAAAVVLPEVVPLVGVEQPPEFHPEGDVFVHTCLVLDHASPGDPIQAWSAVLHDVAKPQTFERAADRIRFSGHDVRSSEMADAVLRRFGVPRELRETVVAVCRDHIRFAAIRDMRDSRREAWMRSPGFRAHLEFHRADCEGSHGKLDIYRWARDALDSLPPVAPPPLCSGADVVAMGVPEGPVIGEILRRLQERIDDAGVSDRDTALRLLRKLVTDDYRV